MIVEWKEPLPGDQTMDWRMEEKENGDRHFTMSVDVCIAVAPLPAGNQPSIPYTFISPWPLDPNAPIIEDEYDYRDEE